MQFYLLLNIPSGTKQDFIDHHTVDTCKVHARDAGRQHNAVQYNSQSLSIDFQTLSFNCGAKVFKYSCRCNRSFGIV